MTTQARVLRWIEMLALFVGGPVLLWAVPGILGGRRLFLFLLIAGLACAVGLYFDSHFDRRKLWNAKPLPSAMGWIVIRWLIACLLLTMVFGLLAGMKLPGLTIPMPTGLFSIFYREVPPEVTRWIEQQSWLSTGQAEWVYEFFPYLLPVMMLIFYPWVSVYPQNVIYRAFFCQRYRPILGAGWGLIIVNAAAFSFGHFMFGNWVVLLLTFVGGLIFTRTYLKHRSLLLATIEHAMYGLFCFYLGVGVFLLYGASG